MVGVAVIGLIVVGMWAFNLLSYKGGAYIALKKLVMNGTYLITAMFCGALCFGEKITTGKLTVQCTHFFRHQSCFLNCKPARVFAQIPRATCRAPSGCGCDYNRKSSGKWRTLTHQANQIGSGLLSRL